MTNTMQSLGLEKLSQTDRLQLIRELWDSIVQEGKPLPMSDALREELIRRADDADAHPEEGKSWEEVKANTRKKLGL